MRSSNSGLSLVRTVIERDLGVVFHNDNDRSSAVVSMHIPLLDFNLHLDLEVIYRWPEWFTNGNCGARMHAHCFAQTMG